MALEIESSVIPTPELIFGFDEQNDVSWSPTVAAMRPDAMAHSREPVEVRLFGSDIFVWP